MNKGALSFEILIRNLAEDEVKKSNAEIVRHSDSRYIRAMSDPAVPHKRINEAVCCRFPDPALSVT